MQPFAQRLKGNALTRRAIDVLQVNMGKYCNQACIHCHVEAGPTRTEMMSRETTDAVLRFLERANIPTKSICRSSSDASEWNLFARCLVTRKKMSIANEGRELLI